MLTGNRAHSLRHYILWWLRVQIEDKPPQFEFLFCHLPIYPNWTNSLIPVLWFPNIETVLLKRTAIK